METTNKTRMASRAWAVIIIAWLGYILINLSNFSYGIMLPSIRSELQFTLGQSGILGASAWIVRAALSIPVAMLVAKFNPKTLLQYIFICVGIGIFLQGAAQGFGVFLLGRSLVYGMAAAVLAPLAVIKINLAPREKIGFLNSLEGFCASSGQTIGTIVVPLVLGVVGGWRNTFFALGIVCIVINIFWAATCKKSDGYSEAMSNQPEKVSMLAPLKEICHYRAFWLIVIGAPFTNIVWSAVYTFWPTYAADQFNFTMEQAGMVLGLLPIGSMVGALVAPKMADIIGYDKLMLWPWGFILTVTYGSTLFIQNLPLLCVVAFITGFGAFAIVPVCTTSFYKLKGISPRAVSIGIAALFGINGVGGAVGSLFAGFASERLGIAAALKICCLAPAVFGVLMLFMPENGRKAMEKRRAAGQEE